MAAHVPYAGALASDHVCTVCKARSCSKEARGRAGTKGGSEWGSMSDEEAFDSNMDTKSHLHSLFGLLKLLHSSKQR